MLLLLLLPACQDPFAEDRHDLASFRIVAVQATPAAGGLDLSAFVYSGLGLWHADLPSLEWSGGGATATGPRVFLPVAAPVEVTLVATRGDQAETAILDLQTPPVPPEAPEWTRGLTSLDITDAGAAIDVRTAEPVGADAPVDPGGGLRFALAPTAGFTTHWLGTGGQFAEIDAQTTDWFAATGVVDGADVTEVANLGPGVASLVALSFDGAGGNGWLYLDAAVALDGPRLHVDGRIFPVESSPGRGFWAFTPVAAETVAGVELTELTPVADASTSETACGIPAGEVFSFAALAEGVCTRDEILGTRLVVEGEVLP